MQYGLYFHSTVQMHSGVCRRRPRTKSTDCIKISAARKTHKIQISEINIFRRSMR